MLGSVIRFLKKILFGKVTRIEIPRELDQEEPISRLILHSFHYSRKKKQIKPEAFAPSPNEKNVISVQRFRYSDGDRCKQEGLAIAERRNSNPNNPCTFIGMAIMGLHEILGFSTESFTISAQCTPMDVNSKVRMTGKVYTDDPGVPSHADIKYQEVEVVRGKPIDQKFKQKVLKPMAQLANRNFYKDDSTTSYWAGDELPLS